MKITQDDKKEIIAAIQSGKTTKELATNYGISSSRIGGVYRKETGKGVIKIGKLSLADRAAIVAELQVGEVTINDLATRYGVSPQTISRNFKQIIGKALHPRQLSHTDKEIIVTELQSGNVTTKDLAIRYGVHRDTISRNFKQTTGKSLRPHQLSQRDREMIVAALQSGKITAVALSVKYGVSSATIGAVYKKATGKGLRIDKLSQTDKETIVAEIQAKKATVTTLAKRYGVHQTTISGVFKKMTGKTLRTRKTAETALQIKKQKNTLPTVSTLQNCRYRAWHKQERKMYQVWGIDWIDEKIQIKVNGSAQWHSANQFIMMKRTGQRDRKRTPEYPDGQKIYAGDIVQFPINLNEKETEIKDVVAFDQEKGMVIVVTTDFGEPLCMHNDECEVIGTIQENPELLGSELQKIRKLLKKYTFA